MTKPKKDNEGEQQPKLFSSKDIVGLVAMIIILIVTFKLLPTDYTWPEIKKYSYQQTRLYHCRLWFDVYFFNTVSL